MAKFLLTDDLWERIKPLLPPVKRNPKGGRARVPDRLGLTGILFVARTGTAWELLPPELNCGSGLTCWRRLRDWQVAGVCQKVWKALLDELGLADKIDWSKAVVDSSSVRALFWGRKLAPIQPIPAKTGRKGMSSATAKASHSR
jgi:transposase